MTKKLYPLYFYLCLVGVFFTYVGISYYLPTAIPFQNDLKFKWIFIFSAIQFLVCLIITIFLMRLLANSERKQKMILKRLVENKLKHRHILDNSHDILFTLDSKLMVKSVNRAVTPQLGVLPRFLIGKNLLDIIFFQSTESETIDKDIIIEKIESLKIHKKQIRFRTSFVIEATGESKPFLLELGYPGNQSGKKKRNTIYGRAQSEPADTLINTFIKERHSYLISNSLVEAEELSHRITNNLKKYLKAAQVINLRIAARELIINAIEHGNLEISFEEKKQSLDEGSFMVLYKKRRMVPELSKRKVKVHALINNQYFILRIEDEGKGFDYKTQLNKEIQPVYGLHGRGLNLAKSEFDSINFNNKGNRITAIYKFAP